MTEAGLRARAIRRLRWVIAPFAVALFVLIGLAVSTEDRQTFQTGDAIEEPVTERTSGGSDRWSSSTVPLGPDDGAAIVGLGYEAGETDLRLGASRPAAAPRTGSGDRLPAVPIPDPGLETATGDRPADGYRIGSDGSFEPVTFADIGPGDAVIRPNQDGRGVDVLQADGSYTEIRLVEQGLDAVTLTAVDPSGGRTPISFGRDGAAELTGGVRVTLPRQETLPHQMTLPGDTEPVAGQPDVDDDPASIDPGRVLLLIVGGALAGALLLYFRRRRRPVDGDEPDGPDYVSDVGVPEERFEEFVAMLAADADPARAIRLAFSAAEAGAGGLPRRLTTETPFEWCERVVAGNVELAPPLRSLTDHFARVRFASVPPSLADRDAAIADLVAVRELASAAGSAPTARDAVPGERPTAGSDRW